MNKLEAGLKQVEWLFSPYFFLVVGRVCVFTYLIIFFFTHVSVICIIGGQTVRHGFRAQSAGVVGCGEKKKNERKKGTEETDGHLDQNKSD